MATCNKILQAAGEPYPRTCNLCQLGPCKEISHGGSLSIVRLPVLTTLHKALALRALVGHFNFALMLRDDGTWYVSLRGASISDGRLERGPTQVASTPDVAVEEMFDAFTKLTGDAHVVTHNADDGMKPHRMRWNGFMWERITLAAVD